jgi:hypothetical protein
MKRWAFTILLFLLLGAVVNVAVAWGCALWSDLARSPVAVDLPVPRVWPSYLQRCHWPPPSAASRAAEVGPGVTILSVVGGDLQATSTGGPRALRVGMSSFQFGLPMRALEWRMYTGSRLDPVKAAGEAAGLRRGMMVPWFIPTRGRWYLRRLPLTPLWLGFAVNTLLYGIVLWLLIPGPFVLRRHVRVRRGRCPKCGYDLRGSFDAGCPECGWNRQPTTAN